MKYNSKLHLPKIEWSHFNGILRNYAPTKVSHGCDLNYICGCIFSS